MLDVALFFFFLHPKPDDQLHGDALEAPDHPALELAIVECCSSPCPAGDRCRARSTASSPPSPSRTAAGGEPYELV